MLGFFAAFAVLAILLDVIPGRLVPPGHWWRSAGRGLIGLSAVPLLAALLIYAGVLRLPGWDRRRVGVPAGRTAVRGAARGLLWGVGLAAAVLAVCVVGGARVTLGPAFGESYLPVAAPVMVGLVLAALLEELLFRGMPLARLAEAVGPVAASVALTVAFVVAHVGNPAVSGLGLANVGLASLVLSAAFFSAGGLPAAFGLHVGWNAGLALAADAPLSGLRLGLPVVEYLPGPRGWLTGGAFGPEGGAAATVVLAGALTWWATRHRAREVAA